MLNVVTADAHLDELEERLCHAHEFTPTLFSDVVATACPRFTALGAATKAKVNRLIESGAWLDATLALVELELPRWKLRRLVREDVEWLCSLSKQPNLPIDLDEAAEAAHEVLPLAILIALLRARTVQAPHLTAVPQIRFTPGHAMCCENFS